MNLVDLVLAQARARPQSPAIIADTRTLTFGELSDGSARAAALFRGAGLVPGDAVLVFVPMGIDLYILLAGLWRGKNPLKMVLGDSLHLPDAAIRTLTIRFALMFFAMAIANEVVWRTQSTLTWGFFKFPGMAIVIFLFTLSQMPLIAKHTPPDEDGPEK